MSAARVFRFSALVVLLSAFASMHALAGPIVIGQWDGSARSWNGSEFTDIRALMIAQGYTVTADQAMNALNLASYDVFVVAEATVAPGAAELSALSAWVGTGGVLLVLGDSSGTGAAGNNAIYAGIGSSIVQAYDTGASGSVLAGGVFATTGPPYDIVGQSLSTTLGSSMSGGTELAGSYIRYEQIGLGYVFGFGDRLDHDFFSPSAGNVNGQLFLNLAARGANGGGAEIPEPLSALLVGSGLLAAGLWKLRRT